MTETVGWLIFSLLHATSCLLWLFQTTQKLPNLHPSSQHSSLNFALPAASQHQQYLSYSNFLDQEPALLSSHLRDACFSSVCLKSEMAYWWNKKLQQSLLKDRASLHNPRCRIQDELQKPLCNLAIPERKHG